MAKSEADGSEPRRDTGDARHSRSDLISQPHQPRQTRRMGTRTGPGRTRATSAAERPCFGKAGAENSRESYPAPTHRTAPEGSDLRQLSQGPGPYRLRPGEF